ncbi:heavy-metal-associated domain-containing protein [Hyunsoonleella aestuarii]|uniref:HMA domain-containing protein n=1 Tax=Hyunsoonleella aestuarii TaxID=912802 RepID=A0ABP8ECW5_9FLAO|nr:heavy-metal-associated domain-containing protein [Hyunsoonleella aestuarii]
MRAQLHIQNLKCGGCKATIINRLSVIKHISGVDLDLDNETVSFDYDTSHDLEKAKHVLSAIGYPIIGSDNKLYTKVKSYLSCAIGRIKN